MNDPERPRAAPRDLPFALFAAGVLAYGAAFAWSMLDRFDLVNLIRDVNADDAFYYFQIAWHMAEGRFSTFDGGLTRTNGYHPLWLFPITPFYWFFDKTEALYAIEAFELGLIAGCAVLVAWAARVARLPWILAFAIAPALYGNPNMYLGLEAAAGLFMLGLFLLAVCLHARDPSRWRWLLSAVAFALPWARLEYVAISLSATAALCLLEAAWRDRAPGASLRERVRSSLSSGAFVAFPVAGAGLLVYFVYNAVVFGGPVPVSGATKLLWVQDAWEREGGYDVVRSLQDALQLPVFRYGLPVALAVCACLPLAWLFLRRSRCPEDRLLLAFLAGAFGVAAGHLAQFAQTVLASHPRSGSYDWYFAPANLAAALLVPAACWVAIGLVRRYVRPRSPRSSRMASAGVVAAGTVFLFASTDFAAPFRFVDRAVASTDRDWEMTSWMGAAIADRLLPEGAVVGSGDAGVLGYFSRFPVVSEDGLANSWDYLRARREGRENRDAFLRRLGIDHFAGARGAHRRFDAMLFEGPPFRSGSKALVFVLRPAEWNRAPWEGIDRSEWFWERMGPHLDLRSNGVGLLMDGRMAQAFADGCAPDEPAMWTWGTDRGDRTVLGTWTKTRTGLCVSAIALPHGALPPVRAAAPAGE